MKQGVRAVRHDGRLQMEACRFEGMVQAFPNHFHDYYVVGAVEAGERRLCCNNREYRVYPGDILLFNPGDSHACTQEGEALFSYRVLNIPQKTLQLLAEELSGYACPLLFSQNVVRNGELLEQLQVLHSLLMKPGREFEKEEGLLLFLSSLALQHARWQEQALSPCREEVKRACALMEESFAGPVTLEALCRYCGLSKSQLLRAFVKEKGVTPYRYLQAVRIGRAKALLEAGVPPAEAGLSAGFSDQSHFSRFFRQFIGLSPAAYGNLFKQADRPQKKEEEDDGKQD